MAKELRHRIALDNQVRKWLEAKGFDLNMVRDGVIISRDSGMTTLTITLFANDFPLDKAPADRICRLHDGELQHEMPKALNPPQCGLHPYWEPMHYSMLRQRWECHSGWEGSGNSREGLEPCGIYETPQQ